MQSEKEEIGGCIARAFVDDEKFRVTLRPFLANLRKVAEGQLAGGVGSVPFVLESTVNSYLVSSFHAASAIENLTNRERELFASGAHDIATLLAQVRHSFAFEAVSNLDLAKKFLCNERVLAALRMMSARSIKDAFDKYFPKLTEARNSLAHDDERILKHAKGEHFLEAIEKMQFRALSGNVLHLKRPDGAGLKFEFRPMSYFPLVTSLTDLTN